MSGTIWYQLGDGTEHNELYATEEEARQALEQSLAEHRARNHSVFEEPVENEHPVYIVKRGDGRIVRKYRFIPAV